MSDNGLTAGTPPPDPGTPPDQDRNTRIRLREQVVGNLLEKMKPWLFEFGNWIFGGLIAFNLVIAVPLLSLGPEHPAILVAMAAFACALPLNVSGLFSLKLIKDMQDVAFDDLMKQAFEDAHVPDVAPRFPDAESPDVIYKKRTDVGLRYGVRLSAVSIVLTLIGMIAALWYMAWWIAAIFIVTVVVCFFLTMNVVARLMRPNMDADAVAKLRSQNQRARAKKQP